MADIIELERTVKARQEVVDDYARFLKDIQECSEIARDRLCKAERELREARQAQEDRVYA